MSEEGEGTLAFRMQQYFQARVEPGTQQKYKAIYREYVDGSSVVELSEKYGLSIEQCEDVIRFESLVLEQRKTLKTTH